MIELTKITGSSIFVNPHLVVTMDGEMDTRLHFASGGSLIVKETQQEVVNRIVEYRKRIGLPGLDI